jgi:di/tricarboxylate transporter
MLDQLLAFGILVALVAMLVWDRFRYDLVAVAALLAAIAVGIVPSKEAFKGFGDDIVIIVGSALVVSAAVARSGIVEAFVRPLAPYLKRSTGQVAILTSAVALLSCFIKNIGALAMLLPVAIQIARRSGSSPSILLMPLSFAALLGGLITLVGTSPNIIVSRMREGIVGEPFGMFDFAPVGLGVTIAGIAFLTLGYRLLPQRINQGQAESLFDISDYTLEARVPPGSPLINRTVFELETIGEAEVTVTGIIRFEHQHFTPHGDWWLFEGDILSLQGDPYALKRIISDAKLELVADKDIPTEQPLRRENVGTHEAVITPDSPLVGRTPGELHLRERHLINLLAVSRGSNTRA